MVHPADGDPGPLDERTPGEPTVDLPSGFLAPGQVLGDRYQVRAQLGRGGMGEVWRAFDLKLRVEVALKALRQDLFQDERRRELLRQEVRAAREVVSPNVCRIFDLIEAAVRELVSMEYVDGQTLLAVLQERGPLELKELLAKLKSLTNLRAVPDPDSDTGWKIEIGPFPGWADVPEWNP